MSNRDYSPAGSQPADLPQPAAESGVEPVEKPQALPIWHPGSFIALLRGRALLLGVLGLAILFTVLTVTVIQSDLQPTSWDVGVTHELQEIPAVPFGVALEAVSAPGFQPWNWVMAACIVGFILLLKWPIEAGFTALAGAGGLLAEVVKVFIDRPRPTPELAHITTVLKSYSFPSGHVTGYVALFGFVFYLAYTLLPRTSVWRWVVLVVSALMILLVGPSRVYMGQHWASDAMAGYALGFAYLLVVIELYRLALHKVRKKPEVAAATGVNAGGAA